MTLSSNQLLSRFSANKDGTVAVWFALTLLPMTLALGSALDYTRATTLRTKLQTATDATILSIAQQALTSTDEQLLDSARKYLGASIPDDSAQVDRIEVSLGRSELKLYTSANYKTAFMQLAGVESVALSSYAKTIVSNSTYEISMVLDISGSMSSSAGGVSKMQAAKDAAKQLVATMFSTAQAAGRTKVSIVPFNLSVKVGNTYLGANWLDKNGQSSIHWENIDRTGWTPPSRFEIFTELNVPWAGCVETRPGAFATSDSPPTAGVPDSYFVPQFAPDEPGLKGKTNYYLNTGLDTGSGTKYIYGNSYLDDDGTGICASIPPSNDPNGRQKSICKYKINKQASKLNTSSSRGPNRNCDAKPMTRMTNNTSTLNTAIDQLAAGGNTDLLEGFMWGWRTLSPNTPFADGVPYTTVNNKKVVVLMTDGMNVWGSANNHNGSIFAPFGYYQNKRLDPANQPADATQARAQIDAKTLLACANAKNASITVYTVGFSTPSDPIDAGGLNLLRQCATSPNMAYVASDSQGIVAVFDEIARNIGTLRLAQ